MIIEAVLTLFGGVVAFLGSMFDGLLPAPPGWVSSSFAFLGDLIGWLYAFDFWLPVSFIFLVVGWVIACWATALLLNFVRVLVSYFTMGGGAT